MHTFALSAIGRDRPGIVAAVTRVLVDHGVNVEDSQATILRGHFTMMLIVTAPEETDEAVLRADLDAAASEVGLEALTLLTVDELGGDAVEPSHIVTVYGVDHPGIVNAAAAALADTGANITDMNTRLVSDGHEQDLYALMIEVAVTGPESELREALRAVGEREGVEVTLRELEQDEL
jgi:glycine cleavage system transcriptional repressor